MFGVRYLLVITAFGVVAMSSIAALQNPADNRDRIEHVEGIVKGNSTTIRDLAILLGKIEERVEGLRREVGQQSERVETTNSLLWTIVVGLLLLLMETTIRIWQRKS